MAKDSAGKWIGYGVGDTGDQVVKIQHRLLAAFPKNSKAKELGVVESGIYDQATANAVANVQPFLKPPQTATGVANFATQQALGATAGSPAPAPIPAHRPIWIYTAPGSGAPWNVGPSFDLGNRCRDVLHINHQPVGYPIGGYLGFMGGDPTYSYNDVIGFEGAELERLIAACPDLNDPNVEFWFSGYSQSADGMEDALVRLFGDGGRFEHLRDRINGVVQFGNPSTKGTGIARKVRPAWLDAKIRNNNYDNDFYAVATDEIRPAFYAIIIEADMELPFFIHVLKVGMGVILNTVPIFGGLLGPLAAPLLAGMTGLNGMLPLLTGLMGTANSTADEAVDKKLTDMLSATGLIKNIPGLIALIGALPGLQAHGGYAFDPVMMQRAYDTIASFRR
jgi:hypothetical protein